MYPPAARCRLPLFLAAAALVLAGWIGAAPAAHADEIVVVDLATGEKSRIRAHRITSETWSEVKYTERPKSRREKSVPTLTVLEIRRTDRGPDAQALGGAIADLSRGNYKEAEIAFQNVCGGGYRTDEATDERVYTSFAAADPDNKRKRPNWTSEYAHYYYAKALLERAKVKKDASLFEEVLWALVDTKLDPIRNDEGKLIKRSTGGFLDRFKGGNSRFYPHAMLAKAEALVGMGEYDKAQTAYNELAAEVDKVGLHPRWLYEGLSGKGVIAHAQGQARDAELAFEQASATMFQRLSREDRLVMMEAYGRLFSQGRTRVAEARLADAEKRNAPSAFKELRNYIQAGSPDSLRSTHKARLNNEKRLKALIAGARDPRAQAVGLNGTGLAYMAEKKYDQALTAFKSVAVKYYGDPDQTSRAYFYIAKAAEEAAKAAKSDETKKMYADMKDEARRVLRTQFRDSRWARK